MVQLQMEFLGLGIRAYQPEPPPTSIRPTSGRGARPRGSAPSEVPVFEPFEESLPLQSGWYSFVIDDGGHFRVKMGNTSSHAAMNRRRPACAAGRLQVNRLGQTIQVVCTSTDYRLSYNRDLYPYVIRSFRSHTAFSLHPDAVFRFHRGINEKFAVDASGGEVEDADARVASLLDEGAGDEVGLRFSADQLLAFRSYVPAIPPTLYAMHRDQLVCQLEALDIDEPFEFGPPDPPFSPSYREIRAGKANFVIDELGRVILGMKGHHLLSGGRDVGGAGHAHLDESGRITQLDLNFSGHYRPLLSGEYVRYVYRAFVRHPLIELAPDCVLLGRWFQGDTGASRQYRFTAEELLSDDPELDERIEMLLI